MDTRRGEERVRYMERVTWKLTSPCVKQTANRNLLCGSGNPNGALYQPRGVGWGGDGRAGIYVYLWLIHGEGNGTPLQYSCLENPVDGGGW